MHLDGFFPDPEPLGDFLVRFALGEETEDVAFSSRQRKGTLRPPLASFDAHRTRRPSIARSAGADDEPEPFNDLLERGPILRFHGWGHLEIKQPHRFPRVAKHEAPERRSAGRTERNDVGHVSDED